MLARNLTTEETRRLSDLETAADAAAVARETTRIRDARPAVGSVVLASYGVGGPAFAHVVTGNRDAGPPICRNIEPNGGEHDARPATFQPVGELSAPMLFARRPAADSFLFRRARRAVAARARRAVAASLPKGV